MEPETCKHANLQTGKVLPFSSGSDEEVQAMLTKYSIALTVEEARKINDLLERDPTLIEAVIWGIQGSEHCSYKSSKKFLKNFVTDSDHIILGPKEDSGIVAITDSPKGKRWGLVIAHESHNHPSQIVPYEGAATGVGGVVRDVLCMGARVVGCMDALRLGDLESEESRSIAREVARGIAGYGNPLGIPNLGGDTVFDTSYNSNCLVNAIALGIVREDEIIHSYCPTEAGEVGYDIILVGKPTDRSGFGGASFASAAMEEDEREKNSGAVQEPNPFLERHLLASFYALFDWLATEGKLDKVSCKDLGAGGVICASVEQVSDVGFGADVDLDKVHTALDGLPAEVIACAETQERLSFTCHPDLTDHILKHFNEDWDLPSIAENARASVIGKVNTSGIYRLTHKGEVVCEAKATDITCGLLYDRTTKPIIFTGKEPDLSTFNLQPSNLTEIFKKILSHPNAASKAPLYLHYDKNVIGNTLLEPGEADAGVIAPLQNLRSYVHEGEHPGWDLSKEDTWRGVAVAADGNGRYGKVDPYLQGLNAAVEAMRNVAAVGATPRALTDCLNYGNPEIPEQLWALEQGVNGIADAGKGITFDHQPIAVISGNVSLYNGKPDGSAIDPTAIVSCIGVMPDARKAVSMQLKRAGSTLYLIGERKDECGGSLYYDVLGELGANVPHPDLADVQQQIEIVTEAISSDLISASHDISEGGLLMALFEMTLPQRGIGGQIGVEIDISTLGDLTHDKILFSETGGFLLEITKEHCDAFEAMAEGKAMPIGKTVENPVLSIKNGAETLLSEPLSDLTELWTHGLAEKW